MYQNAQRLESAAGALTGGWLAIAGHRVSKRDWIAVQNSAGEGTGGTFYDTALMMHLMHEPISSPPAPCQSSPGIHGPDTSAAFDGVVYSPSRVLPCSRTAGSGVPHSIAPETSRLRPRQGARRGTILITAMWAMIILAGVVLLLAQSTSVEMTSSGNRASAVQAEAIESGAEKYVLSLVDSAAGDPINIINVDAETMQVGSGYFWLIRPDPTVDGQTVFGLVDEASKVSLNTWPESSLMLLPNMTQEFADSIIDWRDPDSTVTNQGAESDYYGALQQPYAAKNARFETVEELRLVKGMTEDILFGSDRNHDGVLDQQERDQGGLNASLQSGQGVGRGIIPFVTCYSIEPTPTAGKGTANVNTPNANQAIVTALAAKLSGGQARAQQIVQAANSQRPFNNVFDFCAKGGMTSDEVKAAYTVLSATTTTNKTVEGLLNINTAMREALLCLPGLESADVDTLLGQRTSQTTSTDLSWVYTALGPAKAAKVGAWITAKSYQYSADIIVLTADGRGFKRVRIVVDGRVAPAKIVYRKDVTDLGLPVGLEQARTDLRAGKTLEAPFGSAGSSSVGGGF